MDDKNFNALIIGAGPSGLALAYELIKLKSNIKPLIIDKLAQTGGLARTVYDSNSGIDIGGHRLFTKDKYIEKIWKEFLKIENPQIYNDVLMEKQRFSSIIKDEKKYEYPIKFNFETLKQLGFKSSLFAILSYFKALIFKRSEDNIENFLINRFGLYIYNKFFKEHTKKIWGISPEKLFNEWDKNRIQKSLFSIPGFCKDEFYYPKYGCSQLWDKMAQYIIDNGGEIILNCEFKKFRFCGDYKIISAVVEHQGKLKEIPAKYFISSIPLPELVKTIDTPYDIKQNALNLKYRDYIIVSMYSKKFNLKNTTKFETKNNITPDNWIYLQEKDTIASRMQIMNNWSEYLVRNDYLISFEYFCFENDNLWNLPDEELANLAISEAEKYHLFKKSDVYKTKVIREKKAYPIYTGTYRHINKIKDYLKNYKNLYIMGRYGEHKYINMDYAMVCGITIARDINKRDI